MPRYGYWAPSPAARRRDGMQQLGFGYRERYKNAGDLCANMLTAPYPMPRQGTVTQTSIVKIEAIISHDLRPYGLKFRVRAHDTHTSRLVEVDIEHFVLLKFLGCGMSRLKYYITKKLNDKERQVFKDKCEPLFELAVKAKDIVGDLAEPEPGSVLQLWRGAPKPPKKTKAANKKTTVDENDPWRNKLPQYEPYVKQRADEGGDEVK